MKKLELQLSRPTNIATLMKYDAGLRIGLKKIFGVGFSDVIYVVDGGAMSEYRLPRDNKKLKIIFKRVLKYDYKKVHDIIKSFINHYDEMYNLVKKSERIVSGLFGSRRKVIEMMKKFNYAYEHVWPGVVFIYWLPLWIDKGSLNKEERKRLEEVLKVRYARDMEYVFAQQFYDNIAVYINKKFKIRITFLDMATPAELIKLLKVQGRDNTLMNHLERRLNGCIVFNGQVISLFGFEQINKYLRKHGIELPKPKKIKTNSTLKGLVARTGKANGRVSLLKSRRDMTKIISGDIIISPMTTPYFNRALKKANAVVTDEGGITCHAAIFAREMGIPCIVGTKIATQVLKDGDRVEVDANKGVVRKI
jgi:phosphohistidine swiveling domain-containing protein